MSKKDFKPILIGKDTDTISEQMDKLRITIADLTIVASGWEAYFKEKLTPEKLNELLSSQDIEHVIKKHAVLTDPVFKEQSKSRLFDIEKAIENSKFPNYDEMQASIAIVKNNIERNFGSNFAKYLNRMFVDGEFTFPEEIRKEITKRYTYFTANIRQNLVLKKVQSICDNLNFFNDRGANITAQDLPRILHSSIDTVKGEIKFKDLEGGNTGERDYFVPHLIPNILMFKWDNPLLDQISANMSKEEILKELEK